MKSIIYIDVLFFMVPAVWAVVLLWPRASRHLGWVLQQHGIGLSRFYELLRHGTKAYTQVYKQELVRDTQPNTYCDPIARSGKGWPIKFDRNASALGWAARWGDDPGNVPGK